MAARLRGLRLPSGRLLIRPAAEASASSKCVMKGSCACCRTPIRPSSPVVGSVMSRCPGRRSCAELRLAAQRFRRLDVPEMPAKVASDVYVNGVRAVNRRNQKAAA